MNMTKQRNRKTTIYTVERNTAFKLLVYLYKLTTEGNIAFTRHIRDNNGILSVKDTIDGCKDFFPKHFYDTFCVTMLKAVRSGAFGKSNMKKESFYALMISMLPEKGFGINHEKDSRGIRWIMGMIEINIRKAGADLAPCGFYSVMTSIVTVAIASDSTAREKFITAMNKAMHGI